MDTKTMDTNISTEKHHDGSITELFLRYLKENGYRILKDDALAAERGEDIIAVTKHGHKELIEVKGFPAHYTAVEIKEEHTTITDAMKQGINWFAEALFSSFVNFGKYFKGEKVTLALCLPDTERYRQIIEKVEDYFTDNRLDFKVYLVSKDGEIQQWNLNQNKLKK